MMTMEEIQGAIEALQHKDKLDLEDVRKLASLKSELVELRNVPREEPFKNPYFEMAVLVNRLLRPNGKWNTSIKAWDELKGNVVDYILKRKIEAEKGGGR